jgi:hypothetical protein
MSMAVVYIGRMDDPDFHWDGGNWDGNVPKPITKYFPGRVFSSEKGLSEFGYLMHCIQTGRLEGKQTDWGGFVAPASKQVIAAFFDEIYPNGDASVPFPWELEELRELRVSLNELDDDGQLAIVGAELW